MAEIPTIQPATPAYQSVDTPTSAHDPHGATIFLLILIGVVTLVCFYVNEHESGLGTVLGPPLTNWTVNPHFITIDPYNINIGEVVLYACGALLIGLGAKAHTFLGGLGIVAGLVFILGELTCYISGQVFNFGSSGDWAAAFGLGGDNTAGSSWSGGEPTEAYRWLSLNK